ncbi:MAG TPA: ABC transporter permease [Candidatus Angelobacter sp.]|jgi:putative ABC transport system permease protein|nr:ABC transporter permease [Candidatus Angelobacter sp.]
MSSPLAAPARLRPTDVLRTAGAGMRARRLRTALSALGVAIGIAAVVGVLGISESSRADLIAQLDRLGTNLLSVQPGHDLSGDQVELPAAAPGMVARIGPVTASASTGHVVGATVRRSDLVPAFDTGGLQVQAASPDLLATLGGQLSAGTFLTAARTGYPSVVLGAAAARHLGVVGVNPDVRVWIAGRWFAVTGVLAPLTLAPEIDRSALIGYPAAQQLLDFDGRATTIYVRTDPSQVNAVRGVLGQTVNPPHPDQVLVTRPSDVLAARAAADTALTGLALGLGAVALLVGGVGIANIMVIAVLERRHEVGLRRALGATRGQVATQFLIEALLVSVVGGVSGTVLGTGATAIAAATRGWTAVVPPAAVIGGLAAAVVVGTAAGLYPALRAARLAPTEALRA